MGKNSNSGLLGTLINLVVVAVALLIIYMTLRFVCLNFSIELESLSAFCNIVKNF
ncbi:MAG: hypothetical protein QXO21_02695 [Candidatus Anstonellales archaeon]